MKFNILTFLLSALVIQGAQFAHAGPGYHADAQFFQIRPLEQVNANLWRSGRPSESDLQQAYANGIRVIVDLEDNQKAVKREKAMAQQIGFQFYSFPMNAAVGPTDQQVNAILSMLKSPTGVTLVHCHHGEDRSGMIIGLERVLIEGWTPQTAYKEMLEKGFHPALIALDHYFKEKSGY